MTRDYSLGEIAAYLKAELRGDPEVRITGAEYPSGCSRGAARVLIEYEIFKIPYGFSSIGGYSLGEKTLMGMRMIVLLWRILI